MNWESVDHGTVARIREMVRMVEADRPSFGVLSTGEKCAVALVLDNADMIKWWGSALDCADRVGDAWLRACVYVQRKGWDA